MKAESVTIPVDLDMGAQARRVWAIEKVIALHIGHGWEAESAAELTEWADTLVRYVERR